MKTTKLFFSIALAALTLTSFGRISDQSNTEFENELVVEIWMASPFEAMESDLYLEQWMTAPFESMESELEMESWMTIPFESMGNELVLENWMTTPFRTDALAIECWMTTPFKVTEENCTEVLIAAASN